MGRLQKFNQLDSNKREESQMDEEQQYELFEKENKSRNNDLQEVKISQQQSQEKEIIQKQVKEEQKILDLSNQFRDYKIELCLNDLSFGTSSVKKQYKLFRTYMILLIQQDSEFYLITQYGKMNEKTFKQKEEKFKSEKQAIRAFKKKFLEKTQNLWDNRYDFEEKPGKYSLSLINIDEKSQVKSQNENINETNTNFCLESQKRHSNLKRSIFTFLQDIMNINNHIQKLKEMNFDIDKVPFGSLTSKQLQKAYRVLSDLYDAILYKKGNIIIFDLSKSFYQVIPQVYGMSKVPLIDDIQRIKEKILLVDYLHCISIQHSFMKFSISKVQNPIDTIYDLLEIEIGSLQNNTMKEAINTIIQNSNVHNPQKKIKILDMFEIDKESFNKQQSHFNEFQNKSIIIYLGMLFYGAQTIELLKILQRNLTFQNQELPEQLFPLGKGIYLTDIPAYAAKNCFLKNNLEEGFLIMCETTLGNVHQVKKHQIFQKPPFPNHSLLGVGQNRVDMFRNIENLQFCDGKIEENSGESKFQYNNYVIYDEWQTKPKFIIKFKFDN